MRSGRSPRIPVDGGDRRRGPAFHRAAPVTDAPSADVPPTHPVIIAIEELGPRVTKNGKGELRLDGHPTGPRQLVQAANEVRAARGRPPIAYPGAEPKRRRSDV